MFKKYYSYLPNLKESWILVVFLIVGGSLLSGAVSILARYLFPDYSSGFGIISYPLIFVPPYLWIRGTFRIKNVEGESVPIDNPNFGKLGALFSFMLILPLIFAFNMVIEPLSKWMETPDFMKEMLRQISSNRITSLIMVVILAPLMEELFCRGIILRGLLNNMSPTKAILWSSAIFGIMHLNPWQAIPAFLIGILMGWIYWKTRSLWATIFIHFINNGFAYILTVFFPQLPDDAGYYDIIPNGYYYYFYIAALAFTISILIIMNKFYDKSVSDKVLPNS